MMVYQIRQYIILNRITILALGIQSEHLAQLDQNSPAVYLLLVVQQFTVQIHTGLTVPLEVTTLAHPGPPLVEYTGDKLDLVQCPELSITDQTDDNTVVDLLTPYPQVIPI